MLYPEPYEDTKFTSADEIIAALQGWVLKYGENPAIQFSHKALYAGLNSNDSYRFRTVPGTPSASYFLDGVPIVVDAKTVGWRIVRFTAPDSAKP